MENTDQVLFVIFDCPQNVNDKSWLYDHLTLLHQGRVVPVYAPCVLSTLYRQGIRGFLLYRWYLFRQALTTICKSSRGDILLCWGEMTGYLVWLMKRLFFHGRKVVVMNWLSPDEKALALYHCFQRGIARDPDCQIIVNAQESVSEWCRFLKMDRRDRFHCVPDVYDVNIPFKGVVLKEKKYFFSGGITNRDWSMISRLAAEMPQMKFVCVALEKDFRSKVKTVPSNLQVYYDIPMDEYYRLLSEAFAVLLPLVEQKVSGLINIIRSAQEGIPCLVTRTIGTKQYYPQDLQDLLMCETLPEWKDSLDVLLSMDDAAYMEMSHRFQSYIRDHFSPSAATQQIYQACLSAIQ